VFFLSVISFLPSHCFCLFVFTPRIYEQLPEVQKKREEEKRKSEYNSYRLKAQLYKMVGILVRHSYSNMLEYFFFCLEVISIIAISWYLHTPTCV